MQNLKWWKLWKNNGSYIINMSWLIHVYYPSGICLLYQYSSLSTDSKMMSNQKYRLWWIKSTLSFYSMVFWITSIKHHYDMTPQAWPCCWRVCLFGWVGLAGETTCGRWQPAMVTEIGECKHCLEKRWTLKRGSDWLWRKLAEVILSNYRVLPYFFFPAERNTLLDNFIDSYRLFRL